VPLWVSITTSLRLNSGHWGCEQRGLRYRLCLRKTANVKRLIGRLFRREDCTPGTLRNSRYNH
jgi:hypothetical protein